MITSKTRGARLSESHSGTNLTRAGDYNQRVVLRAIRLHRETTRTELAAMTGLSTPTIANITRRLERDGMIRAAGRVQQGLGQPPLRIALDPDGAFGIGIGIDRDHLSFIVLDLAGATRMTASREIAYPSPQAVRDFVSEQLAALTPTANIDPTRIIGVGLAVPEPFSKPGFHNQPADYAVWNQTDPRALLADLLQWPIHIDNDAAAAANSELNFGCGRECANFFYILVSAGLGGAMVIDGSFYRGATSRSGEIGFLPGRSGVTADQPIERRVSLSALYDRLSDAGCASGTLDALTCQTAHGAAIIDSWIDEAADLLTGPLVAVNCLIDPQIIVVGGRLPEPLIDTLIERLNGSMARYVHALPSVAPVQRARTASFAPAIGAALLPFSAQLLPHDGILMNVLR